ncbi:hypothetical protein CcrRB23_gp485 [Caulobacter phage RB23]|nr:hypothetical protein CcrRB23_gp485 [Caulobacter phage RB23]
MTFFLLLALAIGCFYGLCRSFEKMIQSDGALVFPILWFSALCLSAGAADYWLVLHGLFG